MVLSKSIFSKSQRLENFRSLRYYFGFFCKIVRKLSGSDVFWQFSLVALHILCCCYWKCHFLWFGWRIYNLLMKYTRNHEKETHRIFGPKVWIVRSKKKSFLSWNLVKCSALMPMETMHGFLRKLNLKFKQSQFNKFWFLITFDLEQ